MGRAHNVVRTDAVLVQKLQMVRDMVLTKKQNGRTTNYRKGPDTFPYPKIYINAFAARAPPEIPLCKLTAPAKPPCYTWQPALAGEEKEDKKREGREGRKGLWNMEIKGNWSPKGGLGLFSLKCGCSPGIVACS